MQNSLPWVEKYRPETLSNIISQTDIINTLNNMINKSKLPHIIFYGPPGTGKTTSILACAKQIYGENYRSMILELNGSDDRGINVVREQIKDFSTTKFILNQIINDISDVEPSIGQSSTTDNNIFKKNPLSSVQMKLVILDEADSMTYDAQFALRRVIENFTNNTRFCLICNYLTKIIPALQSRCTIFKFHPILFNEHLNHIKTIAIKEKVQINDDCYKEIINLSEGDMRKSINLLQSLYLTYSNEIIDINKIYQIVGYSNPTDTKELMNILFDKKLSILEVYNYI